MDGTNNLRSALLFVLAAVIALPISFGRRVVRAFDRKQTRPNPERHDP